MIMSNTMKTAISIDDHLLQEADDAARQMGTSRSGLFAVAVRDFLARQRRGQMLLRLNEVYGGAPDHAEKALMKQVKAKAHRTVRERW